MTDKQDPMLIGFSFTAGPALTTVVDDAIAGAARALGGDLNSSRYPDAPKGPAGAVDPLQGTGTTNVELEGD